MKRALPTHLTLPLIFAVAFATGFSGAVVPGSLFIIVVQKSVEFGWLAGPLIMVGHSILELVTIILLITGLIAFARSRITRGLIGIVGGVVLLLLAYQSLGLDAHNVLTTISKKDSLGRTGLSLSSEMLQLVGLGIIMSAVNPYWWIWWATLVPAQADWAAGRGRSGCATYYVGHILSDIVWYTAVAGAISAGRSFLSVGTLQTIYFLTAIFLALLGVIFVFSGVKTLRAVPASTLSELELR